MNLRDVASKSLLAYAGAINPSYQAPAHLVRIAKILQRVESGELKRVILTIPPRHGKSMLCSNYFPAWFLGRNPNKYIISSTYGQELSDDFGRSVRNQLNDPIYHAIFPQSKLAKDSQAANRFNTMSGGSYFSVGAGGAITGRGAHLFLIDDPIKNREDADSPTIRRKLQEWYTSVAYTRLMPGGSIFVIGTRWHGDDLIGWLLKNHRHENWEVINLKAIDDDGNALWPEAYPIPELEKIRQTIGPYDWNSLYQQEPIAKDTAVLDVTKITGYEVLPEIKMVFTAIDPAISKDSKACNTAFCTVGVGVDNHIYDLETIAQRWSFLETLEQCEGVLKRHKPLYLGVEAVAYQKALYEACQRYFPNIQVIDLKADKDKFRRAKSVSHLIEQGLFHSNNRELLSEIAVFDPEVTGDAKKDRVDAMVHALHMVQMYSPAKFQKEPKNEFEGMTATQKFFVQAERQYRQEQAGGGDKEIIYNKDIASEADANYY